VEASEVMTRQPIHVAPSTSLREAARLMLDHKIGCLPVVDGSGAMVGLVTDSDLLRGAYGVTAGPGAP
jgi:CBS domain-containing protein